MITRIREVRKAKGLTLEQVGALCDPPTTAQTIGRLETGTRTVSIKWLNRIALALDVASAELVALPGQSEVPVAALLGPDGARARPARSASPPPLRRTAWSASMSVPASAIIAAVTPSGAAASCRRISPARSTATFCSRARRAASCSGADRAGRRPAATAAAGFGRTPVGADRPAMGRSRGTARPTALAKKSPAS